MGIFTGEHPQEQPPTVALEVTGQFYWGVIVEVLTGPSYVYEGGTFGIPGTRG
jgi:hypothetical protein